MRLPNLYILDSYVPWWAMAIALLVILACGWLLWRRCITARR
ncbi:MAG TPA: hypothetical protein VGZ27_09155 [Vicinamibacterales bacterium]|nr:hypothetical protein [Vicinamibacterales bacterium]